MQVVSGTRVNNSLESAYASCYSRLRQIAGSLMWREAAGHTLQPTALVNELFIKLGKSIHSVSPDDQFFRLASHLMGQILIDHSRVKRAKKRIPASKLSRNLPDLLSVPSESCLTETAISARIAFEELEQLDAMVARTIWYRLVERYTWEEVASLQRRLVWQVREDHAFGLQWLTERLGA